MSEPSGANSNQVDGARRHFNKRIGKFHYLGRSKSLYWASKRRFRSI